MRVEFVATILFVALLLPSFRVEARAQVSVRDTAGGWVGQRIIMVQGMGAVHVTDTSDVTRTMVGINLVMPVRRVSGRQVWIVPTSGGDSGWVDIGIVRLPNGAIR